MNPERIDATVQRRGSAASGNDSVRPPDPTDHGPGGLRGRRALISYDGTPWQYGVELVELRDRKMARDRIYVTEGWEAPEWRAPWRSDTPADPPESVSEAGLARGASLL